MQCHVTFSALFSSTKNFWGIPTNFMTSLLKAVLDNTVI